VAARGNAAQGEGFVLLDLFDFGMARRVMTRHGGAGPGNARQGEDYMKFWQLE
jgi:hypothetical protein